MTLYEKIITMYPDLTQEDFIPQIGIILIQNNSDGTGDYIAKWDYPYPEPTAEQLASIQ